MGSSARITLGSTTSARAMPTRCCSLPELVGEVSARSASPTLASACRTRPPLAACNSRVDEGSSTFLYAVAGDQVVRLEDEADPLAPDAGAARLVERGHLLPDELVGASVGRSRQPRIPRSVVRPSRTGP